MLTTYLIFGLLGAVVFLLGYSVYLTLRINRLLRNGAASIEDSVRDISKEMENIHQFRLELEPYLQSVEKRLKRSTQGLYTLRFDPFRGDGSGGKQSFATAILSEEGNGVILSSLHSRDRMSVFAKPVEKFASSFDLTEEEAEALLKAKESCTL